MALLCPYCKRQAKLTTGKDIYPNRKDLYNKKFWKCIPCHAYVGCHNNTCKPLGRLANKELRQAKIKAHKSFDILWKDGSMTRSSAYRFLAKSLGIDKSECHIGMFDIDMCNKVIKLSKKEAV